MKEPILLRPANVLRRYHSHQVVGMGHVPSEGGALIVVNHSIATYDALLLGAAIYSEKHRLVHALGHKWLFALPIVSTLMKDAGAVSASPTAALKLLQKGQLLGIAPGGMREALRPSTERYRLRWEDRKGFVRLSIQSGAPIVLGACPRADEIYDVHVNAITDFVYTNFRLPAAFVWGRGPLPRPVKLTHYLSEPLLPPPAPKSKKKLEALVDEWHAELTERMEALMERRE